MSNEAPSDEEVTARVMAAVVGDFQPEQMNGFPVKPEEGYYDMVSLLSYRSLLLAWPFSFRFLRHLCLF